MLVLLGVAALVAVALGGVVLVVFGGGVVTHDPRPARTVDELIRAGQKIDAIKLYRETHRVSLVEAKDAVEALARGVPVPPAPGLDPEMEAAIRAGDVVGAIGRYKEKHRVGLKESKQAIDKWRSQHER